MPNRSVTITLDEETARWARMEAARRDTSVSGLVGEMLERLMRQERAYETAMASFTERSATRLKAGGAYPGRAELHERAGLR